MVFDFQHKGFWFIPSDPTNKIAGTIVFSTKNGISLDLFGRLKTTFNDIEIIWGELEDGKYVTLLNSFASSVKNSAPGFSTVLYKCTYLFIGAHFTNEKDIIFYKTSIHYSDLDEWLNISSGFKMEMDPKEYKINIEYKLPNPIDVRIHRNMKLSVNLTAKPPSRKIVQTDAIIRQKAYIDFEYKRGKSFEYIIEDTFHFQNYLTLCYQSPAFHKEFIGYIKIEGKLYKVDVFFRVNYLPETRKEKIPDDFLLPFSTISYKFSTIIKSWYRNKKQLSTSADPYFSAYYNPNLYTIDKFLNLIKSVEAFHRDTTGLARTPNRTRYTFVYNLHSRQFNSTLKIKNKTKFIAKLVKYRNDYTHSNPILEKKDKRFVELYYISEKLQIIMTCAFLYEHFITKKEIKASITTSRLYNHLRRSLK